jgi:thiamine kinase-like enzyme
LERGAGLADITDIVTRLEALLGPASGDPVPLEGGITNRNYRVRFGDGDYVVRLPGKDTALLGISREAERQANAAAAALGLAPAVAAALDDCLVTEFVACEQPSAAELRAAPEQVAAVLRTFHDRAPDLPVRFWVPDLLEDYERIVRDGGRALPDDYARAGSLAARIAAALPREHLVPCHDDLLTANLIRGRDGSILLVDWEYAGMGHRMFDLGNLSVNNDFDARADVRLLSAYFGEPPDGPQLAALALMRIMSDIREAAWGVVQAAISELPFDFDGYAAAHFSRMNEAASSPRFEELLDAAGA